jgi:serine/threonine-protein kinase
MSRTQRFDVPELPVVLARQVDQVCDEFEDAWAAGGQPRPEDFLGRVPQPARAVLLRELILVEAAYRRRRGEDCRAGEYEGRFPGLDPVWLVAALAPQDPGAASASPTRPTSTLTLVAPAGEALPAGGGAVGDYELLRELGRGGMGVVYQAWQTSLSRMVALKMVLAGADAGPEELARFRAEAEAVARLQHPNIVQIYQVGEHDGRPFFAMELVEGGSLDRKLAGTPRPAREAAALAETLARTVHHAHQRGIVHRDLKPANVLLTEEGTPKVTDFGLAKVLVGARADPTLTGAVLGTPAYMAPEQASGRPREVGPAADVYALGAILYELLTGRPPFLGETPLDTLEQVRARDPIPPRQLRPKVPRDLETVCLKCLRKEPGQRYASALDLADDLRRFLAGESIRARPVGAFERAAKWVRRRPARAALVVAGLVVLATLLGAGAWADRVESRRRQDAARQEGELRQGVASALETAVGWVRQGRWDEARAVLGLARNRLGDADLPDLREQLGAADRDLDLAERLDAIRLKKADVVGGRLDYAAAYRAYRDAFAAAGLAGPGAAAADVAARVRASAIRDQLVAVLDDWAGTPDREERAWLRGVLRAADPDPGRDRFRDPRVREDRAALEQFARGATPAGQSPQLLVVLAERLKEAGADPVPVLRHGQRSHPRDFWLTFRLADALREAGRHGEAAEYFRIAAAFRPGAAVVHNNLAASLLAAERWEPAREAAARAAELDPGYAYARANLAAALSKLGRGAEALPHIDRALELEPDRDGFHFTRGAALHSLRRPAEAVESYRRALAINPKFAAAHLNLGQALTMLRKPAEALPSFERAVALDPNDARSRLALGMGYGAANRLDDAVAQYREATALNPRDAAAFYNLGHCLYRLGRLEEAVTAYRQATVLKPDFLEAHDNLGRCLLQGGRCAEAVDAYRRAVASAPGNAYAHDGLVTALLRAGLLDEARSAAGRALQSLPAADPARPALDARRQLCDRLLALDGQFPALVRADRPPAGTDPLLAAQLCRYRQAHAAAARFYSESFAAAPGLAGQDSHRDDAACSAALAGCGEGRDSLLLDGVERARLRRQARDWLRAEFARWDKQAKINKPAERGAVEQIMVDWQTEAALSRVRDAAGLARLPAPERQEWEQLWRDVAALVGQVRTVPR